MSGGLKTSGAVVMYAIPSWDVCAAAWNCCTSWAGSIPFGASSLRLTPNFWAAALEPLAISWKAFWVVLAVTVASLMSLWFVVVPPVPLLPPHAASTVNAERAPANANAAARPGRRTLPFPSRERGEDQTSALFDCLIRISSVVGEVASVTRCA